MARPSHLLQPQDQVEAVKTLFPEVRMQLKRGLTRISSRTRSAKWFESHVLHIPVETNNARKVNLKYFSVIDT